MNSKNSKSPAIPTLKINQTSEDREIEKLTKELQKHKEMRDELSTTCTQLKKELSRVTSEQDAQFDCIWKDHYDHQCSVNVRLEKQLAELKKQLHELKHSEKKAECRDTVSDEDLTLIQLQQHLEYLKKEKAELDWMIHEHEWRLDKEGMIRSQTEDGLREVHTRINETTARLIDIRHRRTHPPGVTELPTTLTPVGRQKENNDGPKMMNTRPSSLPSEGLAESERN